MKIKNMTPHSVTVGSVEYPPSGEICRVSTSSIVVDTIDGVDVVQTTYGHVDNLPDPIDGNYYIVSRMVKDRVLDRHDCIVPDGIVRDNNGKIIGATRWSR